MRVEYELSWSCVEDEMDLRFSLFVVQLILRCSSVRVELELNRS